MTTPINTFQDILYALDSDPTLVEQLQHHLLTKRLLELPDVVAEITEQNNQLAATVSHLVAVVTELQAGQARLESDVSQITDGQSRLEVSQYATQADLNRISGTIGRIYDTVGRLDITDYESRAAKILPRFARMHLDLPWQTAILHCDARHITIDLPEFDQALDSGIITPDQLESMQDADVIVAGSPLHHQPGFILAESSITVQIEDVSRAAERADILQRATKRTVLAAVIGIIITAEAATEAKRRGVQFIRTDREGRHIL